MKLTKLEAQTSSELPLVRLIMRRMARLLLQPLALAIVIQPAAFAAPNPSLLAQLPKYMDSTAASNAVFVMDDSQSMLMMELPIPPGINPALPSTIAFSLDLSPRPMTGATSADVSRTKWIVKSPTLNPAYYNPIITYRPWNYDGRKHTDVGEKKSPFAPSDITLLVDDDGFRRGLTPHDPRFLNETTAAFAIPNHLGSGARAKDSNGNSLQHFVGGAKSPGGSWGGQDIFSRRMIKTICQQCVLPPTAAAKQCAPHVDCSGTLGAWRNVDFATPSTIPQHLRCPAAVESGFVNKDAEARWYCNPGEVVVAAGSSVFSCTAGAFSTSNEGNTPFCCPTGSLVTSCSTVTNCPAGQTCPTVGRYVTIPNELVIAHYFRYEGDVNGQGKNNPDNYKLVEIERFASEKSDGTGDKENDHLFLVRSVDGATFSSEDQSVRPECTAAVSAEDRTDKFASGPISKRKACTWKQEAQNFANWYTYYRTRLFSAIAVTAEALSGLKSENLLDRLRLGYGSINYFNNSKNPYSVTNPWDFDPASSASTRTVGDVDAHPSAAGFVSNFGTLNRGVREFRQGTPQRDQVFKWLFSLRPNGATPNREALDSVGRYFSRKDAWGPWSETPGAVPVLDTRPVDQHASCRRSYAILVTDGEWTATKPVPGAPPVQPLLDDAARQAAIPAWVAGGGATPLNAASVEAPRIPAGVGKAQGIVFPPPGGQPQFTTVANSPTGTLTDVAYYWWSRDLRDDLDNNIQPLVRPDTPPERVNESYWQNVTPFIVGYGLTATMDLNPATRIAINSINSDVPTPSALTWPEINTENDKVRDAQCGNIKDIYDNISGCGRINDTFRAGRMARGDFFAATDVVALAKKVAEVLANISEVDGSGVAYTGRSATLMPKDVLYSAKFTTSSWTGSVEAFDANKLNETLLKGTPAPSPIFVSNFDKGHNIFTSTGATGAGAEFNFNSVSAAQKVALGDNGQPDMNNPARAVIAWLSGDQSVEAQNKGTLRNRGAKEILGDIINSNPLYSGAADARYTAYRHPAASKVTGATSSTPIYAAKDYPDYVRAKKDVPRPTTIFVGANDGMLHAFDASDLSERFAYVPRAVYPELAALTTTGYIHKYYVDGPVVEGDVYIGGKWRTVLVGTNGAGPKGIYALDVTQLNEDRTAAKSSFGAGDVMWDLAANLDTGLDALGHITQPGIIGSGLDGEWYYFTGNGWESNTDKASLLAIRIRDGEVHEITASNTLGGSDPVAENEINRPNGLGGVTPIYDGHRNVVGIYAGDRLGRLWKFDLNSDTKSKWKVEKALFETAQHTLAGVTYRQPITAAPRVMAHPNGGRLIAVGTGRLTESTDISDLSVQSIYAFWEQKPTQVAHPNSSLSWPLNSTNLHEMTLSQTVKEVIVEGQRKKLRTRYLDRKGFFWGMSGKEGWRLDLKAGTALGERVIVSPIEQGGFLNVSTFEPVANGDKCQGGGASFFYRFDVAQTFERFALNSANADIVGEELAGGSVGGMRLFGTGTGAAEGKVSTIDKGELTAALKNFGRNGTATAGIQSACASTAGGRTIANKSAGLGLTLCPNQAQRVWRELPRGAR